MIELGFSFQTNFDFLNFNSLVLMQISMLAYVMSENRSEMF